MTVIFIVVRIVPGDPAAVLLGPTATVEQVAEQRSRMGLDEPLVTQYRVYLASAIQGDFGQSTQMRRDALELVLERAPATARLAVSAMALALVASFPLGIAAALRPRSLLDRAIAKGSLIGQATPNFWVGIMLILLFSRQLQLLPSSGSSTWKHLILPSITLALPFLSILVRLVRGGLLEVLNEDYIVTARAKGLTQTIVLYRHALKNVLIPVITVAGLQFGSVLGGTVIVETVFSWPGIGRLLVNSIANRDYAVVQASIFSIALVFVTINLLVDLSYGYLDPRVRIGDKQ